jgi:serine/threonine protein kinase
LESSIQKTNSRVPGDLDLDEDLGLTKKQLDRTATNGKFSEMANGIAPLHAVPAAPVPNKMNKVEAMLGMSGWQVVHSGVLFQLRSTLSRGTLKRPRVCVIEELHNDGLIVEGRMRGYSAKHPDRVKFEIQLTSDVSVDDGGGLVTSTYISGTSSVTYYFNIICSDMDDGKLDSASSQRQSSSRISTRADQAQWQTYCMCTEDEAGSIAWMDAIKRVKFNVLLCLGTLVQSGFKDQDTKDNIIKFDTLKFDDKDVIGQGSSGTVYRGTWRNLTVAIKKIPVMGDEQEALVEEVANEAKTLAQLRHPYIANFYGLSASPRLKALFVVTDLYAYSLRDLIYSPNNGETGIDGFSLADHSVFVKVATEIASAVAFMHQHRVMHRDIKPANVYLDKAGASALAQSQRAKKAADSSTDSILEGSVEGSVEGTVEGSSSRPSPASPKLRPLKSSDWVKKGGSQMTMLDVKLGDFGLARQQGDGGPLDNEMTMEVGTPIFMAPELMMGEGDANIVPNSWGGPNADVFKEEAVRRVGDRSASTAEEASGDYDSKIDVYAFGVLLWTMFVREHPYSNWRSSSFKLMMMVLSYTHTLYTPTAAVH